VPTASPIACRCGKLSYGGATSCDECKKKSSQRHSASRKEYKSWRWQQLSLLMRRANPMCQRIVDGEFTQLGRRVPCRSKSQMVHHIVSPDVDFSKMYDTRNLVALCDHCHNNSKGTEAWIVGIDYSPTKLPGVYVAGANQTPKE
jgi:hypothetical protein